MCGSDRVAALLRARTCRTCQYGWMEDEVIVEELERQQAIHNRGPRRRTTAVRLPFRET